MNVVLLSLIALAAAPEFTAQPLEGPPLSGSIVTLDAKQVVLESAQKRVTLDLEKLATLTAHVKSASPAREPSVGIDLVDGSSLVAQQYTVREGRGHVVLQNNDAVDIATRDITSVRFQSGNTAMQSEWSRIAGLPADRDLLVTVKGESIDYHKGQLHDITAAQVHFDLDGESLAVKRGKIYGLLYYHPSNGEAAEPLATILDADGSRWSARTIALVPAGLEWTTPSGTTVRRPLEQIAKIDLSRGKIIYLSDLKPESAIYTPYFGREKESSLRGDLWRLRTDSNLESKPITLDRKIFRKGLAMHSRSEVVYLLPGRFSRFEAVAGIDDGVRPRGDVRLVLRGDNKTLLEMKIAGSEAARPISVDVAGVRRLSILVDFGDDMDVADHLDLGDARIRK